MAIKGAKHGVTGRGSYNVGFTMEGNWGRFASLVDSSPILLTMAAREGQKKFAEEYRDSVKSTIRTGGKRFGYKPLGQKYLQYKNRKGGSSRLLVWSETMLNSISIIYNRESSRWMVGIEKGLKRPNYPKEPSSGNRLQVHEYANILEHGRPPYMPARPFFSDTFRKTMGGKRGLKTMMELHIIKRLSAAGIIVNKM